MTTAFVLVDAEPAQIEALAHAIADLDVMLEVASVDDVATIVTHHVARMEGIRRTRTAVAFREYSSTQLDAAFEDFGD
jgi:DNA-binding Lrp family transcriptional regulator